MSDVLHEKTETRGECAEKSSATNQPTHPLAKRVEWLITSYDNNERRRTREDYSVLCLLAANGLATLARKERHNESLSTMTTSRIQAYCQNVICELQNLVILSEFRRFLNGFS